MKSFIPIFTSFIFVANVFAQHTGHPRLFFTAADIPGIVSNVDQQGSAASQLYNVVITQSTYFGNNYLFDNPGTSHNKAAYYHTLLSLAFRYLKEKQDNIANYSQWSDRAKFFIFNPTDPNIHDDEQRFIQQGMIYDDWPTHDANAAYRALPQRVIFLSVVYDWLYDQLDAAQRTQIQQRIIDDINWSDTWVGESRGIRADFTQRDDVNRWRVEHPILALLLGPMSIYGENPGYSTTQADQDITAVQSQLYFPVSDNYYSRRSLSLAEGLKLKFVGPLWFLGLAFVE